jgi:hypothetical protein
VFAPPSVVGTRSPVHRPLDHAVKRRPLLAGAVALPPVLLIRRHLKQFLRVFCSIKKKNNFPVMQLPTLVAKLKYTYVNVHWCKCAFLMHGVNVYFNERCRQCTFLRNEQIFLHWAQLLVKLKRGVSFFFLTRDQYCIADFIYLQRINGDLNIGT